jgi:hypothetical protein
LLQHTQQQQQQQQQQLLAMHLTAQLSGPGLQQLQRS